MIIAVRTNFGRYVTIIRVLLQEYQYIMKKWANCSIKTTWPYMINLCALYCCKMSDHVLLKSLNFTFPLKTNKTGCVYVVCYLHAVHIHSLQVTVIITSSPPYGC